MVFSLMIHPIPNPQPLSAPCDTTTQSNSIGGLPLLLTLNKNWGVHLNVQSQVSIKWLYVYSLSFLWISLCMNESMNELGECVNAEIKWLTCKPIKRENCVKLIDVLLVLKPMFFVSPFLSRCGRLSYLIVCKYMPWWCIFLIDILCSLTHVYSYFY